MGDALTCWVHNGEQVSYSFFHSMQEMTAHVVTHDESRGRGGFLPIRYGTGGLVEARNTAVAQFLRSDCEWLFWIDTDMGFDGNTLDRLIDAADPVDRPVVGALCFVNSELRRDGMGGYVTAAAPTTYAWARNPDGAMGFVPRCDFTPGEVLKVDATGSACIVIHRSVFERIATNWYGLIASPDGRPFGEDFSFCLRCVEHGIPIHVATGVVTTHLKPIWLTDRHMDALPVHAIR